jgi:hypothetical protein
MDETRIITVSDESAVQQSSRAVIWTQVWVKLIDNFSLSNMIKTVSIVSLGLGGLIFFIYFWSIGFMPEIDLKAIVYLLAVSGIKSASASRPFSQTRKAAVSIFISRI